MKTTTFFNICASRKMCYYVKYEDHRYQIIEKTKLGSYFISVSQVIGVYLQGHTSWHCL